MPLNFSHPITSQDRAAVLSIIRDHVTALAKMLDGETLTNTPTNAMRYSAANSRFEKFNGSSWVEAPLFYLKTAGGTLTGGLTGTTAAFDSLTVAGQAVWHAGNLTPSNYQLAATAWNTSNFDPTTKQNVSTAWNQSNFDPATKQNVSTAWNTSNFNPDTKANLNGANFSGNITAPNVSGGYVASTGAGAFVGFNQRDSLGITWGWYATGGWTYLWNGGTNVFQVSNAGHINANNGSFAGAGYFANGLSVTGSISATGNIAGYSDSRLKSAIEPYHLSIDDLITIQPKKYEMFGRRNAGLLAQQVQPVAPYFVHADSDGMLALDYGRFAAVAVMSLAHELRAKGVL